MDFAIFVCDIYIWKSSSNLRRRFDTGEACSPAQREAASVLLCTLDADPSRTSPFVVVEYHGSRYRG